MGSRGRRGSGEHREFEDMAVAHVVGGLSVDEGRLFRSHLLECTSCRARVGELRAIAHDLADVERDERRQRAANRTDTKAREGEDADAPVTRSPRLTGRATLLVAAGLLILMSLSAWNFILRGQLQISDQRLEQLRASIRVLQGGEEWRVVSTSTTAIIGHVAAREETMAIMVEGLAEEGRYALYLVDADGITKHRDWIEADNGAAHALVADAPLVRASDHVYLQRSPELTTDPTGTTVFEAQRPENTSDEDSVELQPVGVPTP